MQYGTNEQPETIWEALLMMAGAISVAGIVALVIWYGISSRLGTMTVSPVEGAEEAVNDVASADVTAKWDSLLSRYAKILSTITIPMPVTAHEEEVGQTKLSADKEQDAHVVHSAVEEFIKYANPKLNQAQVSTLTNSLIRWAGYYRLPIGLIVGVTHAESNFRTHAEGVLCAGGHRAVGPMQVMWPMHQKLAKNLGVRSKQAMFGDLGVKVGCYLLKNYVQDEHSIIGGLKRYLSSLSKVYILDKVLTDWMTLEQLVAGTISVQELRDTHQTEKDYMRRLTGRK